MPKTLSTKNTPEIVFYKKLKLPQDYKNNSSFIKNLRKEISVQAQGEPVEMDESPELPILMVALDVVRKVSPEAALTFKSGERILLFDHQARKVLRPEDVNIEFVGDKQIRGRKSTKRSLTLNIESELRPFLKKGEELNLYKSYQKIKKTLKTAKTITLVGKKSKLLILLVQYLCYPLSKEIYYQENIKSQPLIIYK